MDKSKDVNEQYNILHDILIDVINKNVPFKTLTNNIYK